MCIVGVAESGLSGIWSALVAGDCCVTEAFTTEERAFVVLKAASPSNKSARSRRNASLIIEAVNGERSKVIASDVDRSISTVAARIGTCLINMGAGPTLSRMPLFVIMAAWAASNHYPVPLRIADSAESSASELLVSVERPDRELPSVLTRAEAQVLRLYFEGRSHVEIGTTLGRSPRTVANQLASVFSKRRISGRLELLAELMRNHSTRLEPVTVAEGSAQRPNRSVS